MSAAKFTQYQYEIGARISRGDFDGAESLAAECRVLWPMEVDGWLYGSMAALFAERKEEALALIDQRLATDAADTRCLIQKAECLLALGLRDAAIETADAAATSAFGVAEALDAIGGFLAFAQDHSHAVDIYDRAVSAAPADADLVAKRAVLHQFLGQFDLAERDFQAALSLNPAHSNSLKGLTELRRQSTDGNLAAAMQIALGSVPIDSKDAATLHLGLAKTYEDIADYPRSWEHLTAANRLERARLQYVAAQDRETFRKLIHGFPDEEPILEDTTGESPIFIVGMPRTGTTLVERIIGNHSAVHSAGELAAMADSVATIAVRDGMLPEQTWMAIIGAMGSLRGEPIARQYLDRVRPWRGNQQRFSDKAPANFFYCALIFRAFPRARIVHLTRHPMAACYAIYKTRFNGGYPFAYDMTELGDFYAGYRQLMAHWHRILPDRIFDVAYEDVVTNQEATTRGLLDYLGLAFEPACLDFHLNPDATSTSSSVQVRSPLYETSLRQWQNYAMELAPLRASLLAGGITADELAPTLTLHG